MGNLLNFAIYNPAILSDDDFLTGFIARNEQAESLLQGLKRLEPTGAPKHRLIIGQRGMGKTSLLRRMALGIEQNEELATRLLPLSFREEQYNVHNLNVFWLNCLNSLADYFDRNGRTSDAEAVDNDISQLERSSADADGEASYRVFKDWCKRENKRPLLLLDNIDIIFDGIAKQDWAFRRVLQERGGPVVFGATVNPLEATAKIEAAFYDFFQVTMLEKLSFDELMRCLHQLAERRGEDGQKVKAALNRDPARIHTLYDFTGGNPRTLTLLYLLLELDPEDDVMSDLERLLDQVSVLYKARVEDLAPQARVVLDAIALAWNPVAMTELKTLTGLENSAISAQLDRLQKNGIIEKTALSGTRSAGYQLGERLFNIWYLMRHGQRRQRNRLRWLSEFLRGFYHPTALRDLAQKMAGQKGRNGISHGMYCLAMREAVDEPALQRLLKHRAASEFERHAAEVREPVRHLVDADDLDGSTHTMAELKKAVLNCQRQWREGCSAEQFWDLLGGDWGLSQLEKMQLVNELPNMPNEELLAWQRSFQENIDVSNEFCGVPQIVEQQCSALRDGLMQGADDLLGAMAAIERGDDPRLLLMCHYKETEFSQLSADELTIVMAKLQAIFTNTNQNCTAAIWENYGYFLVLCKDYLAAEQAYREVIKLNPVDAAVAWYNLGKLLAEQIQSYPEAEQAYRESIRLNPDDADAWNNLSKLLAEQMQRYPEAEQACRETIRLNPDDADAWYNLGILLKNQMQRHPEAEQAYREAIRLNPDDAVAWCNLGNLLGEQSQRYPETEQAYREAIRLNPNYTNAWNNLGNLLVDCLHNPKAAETAYLQCLVIDSNNIFVAGNLAYLLLTQTNRQEDAENYYQQAVSQLPAYGAALLSAYRDFCQDNAGAALTAFAEALNSDADELFSDYFDDMLRVLRLAEQRGYGKKVLDWLDQSGLGERYWPLRAAYDAYLHGETKLRDVNPEVRNAASRIYASMERLRKPAAIK